VLDVEAGQSRPYVRESDFRHDGVGGNRSDELTVCAVFGDLNLREQGRMASVLSPSLGPARARIGIRAVREADDHVITRRVGGDHLQEDIEARALGAACHTYLPPLRNAETDLTEPPSPIRPENGP
jgi:hypothetical protein